MCIVNAIERLILVKRENLEISRSLQLTGLTSSCHAEGPISRAESCERHGTGSAVGENDIVSYIIDQVILYSHIVGQMMIYVKGVL